MIRINGSVHAVVPGSIDSVVVRIKPVAAASLALAGLCFGCIGNQYSEQRHGIEAGSSAPIPNNPHRTNSSSANTMVPGSIEAARFSTTIEGNLSGPSPSNPALASLSGDPLPEPRKPNSGSAAAGGGDPIETTDGKAPAAQEEGADEEELSSHMAPVFSRWYGKGNPYVLEDVVIGGAQLGDVFLEPPDYEEVNRVSNKWNSYQQNRFKGDFPLDPINGEDLFLDINVTERLFFEQRKLPIGTGITGSAVNGGTIDQDFFGGSKVQFGRSDLAVSFDLFKGQQAFKPVEWRLKITPVFTYTDISLDEVGGVKINVADGRTRQESDVALQEALFEYHLFDITDRYDFVSSEIGILPFRSDFRGFIFDDTNLGARLFGNYDENRWQYNLVYFDMLDKDTNSELNKFEDREQEVFIANVYRQDWPVFGFVSQFSFHLNNDHRSTEFDDNGFLVSPAPVGLAKINKVKSYYLGWTGEGHLDRINVTHALYHAFGKEDLNPFAAREVDIDAQMAALEISYDVDWWRPRLFFLYASGDDDTRDGDAKGFDAILDAPNFAGGPLSFFNSQAIRLLGVNLTNAFSPLPDLQSNKLQGQSNFVNPGLHQIGGAIDVELTPTWRAQFGGSYLRFAESDPLEVYLELPRVEREIGYELFMGTQWRPWLTNNVILQAGASALVVGDGFERIYQSDQTLYSAFLQILLTW